MLNIEQVDLARMAAVSRNTLMDFESGRRVPRASTVAAIRAALAGAGVDFIPENGGGHGVRLRARGG